MTVMTIKIKLNLALLLTILSILMIWQASVRFLAGIDRHTLTNNVNYWLKTGQRPSLKDWQFNKKLAENALSLTPNNSDLLLAAGKLYEFSPSDSLNKEHLKIAVEYYRRAVDLTPSWPYGWKLLAYGKYSLKETDKEFQLAFQKAIETGPWETESMERLSNLSFRAWNNLTPENKKLALKNLEQSVRRSPSKIYSISIKQNRLPIFCKVSYRQNRTAYNKYCKKK